MRDRLLEHWHAASVDQIKQGLQWYPCARHTVDSLADETHYPSRTVAGVVAALSIRKRWAENVEATRRMLLGFHNITALPMAREKASKIMLDTDACPEVVLRGPKVRAFYRALIGDDEAVVLDVWMNRAMGAPERYTTKQYAERAEALREAAASVGLPPAPFQAVVWGIVRGGYV